MDAVARMRGQSGQATVEHVGLVVVIALLLAAVGAWAATADWAPGRPPDVVARVAQPLARQGMPPAAAPAVAVATGQQALERVARALERDDDGAPGALRRAWDAALWWGVLNVDGQIEAGRGFLEQVGVRAEDLVKDPVKTIEGAVERLSKPPVTGTAERVGRIARSVATAGDRPFRETFLQVSRDVGGLGADWLIAKFARGVGGMLRGLLPG